MFPKYEFRRLLLKNFRTLLFFLIPILILSSTLLYFQIHFARQSWQKENKEQIYKSAADMDVLFSTVSSDALQTAYNSKIFSFFTQDHFDLSQTTKLAYEKMQLQMRMLPVRTNEMDHVFFYCAEPEYYVTLNAAISLPGGSFDWESQNTYPYPFAMLVDAYQNQLEAHWFSNNHVLYFYQPVSRGQIRGGFLLRFGNQQLSLRMASQLSSDRDQFFLINESGQIIASSVRPSDAGEILDVDLSASTHHTNGQRYSVFVSPCTIKGYQYVLLSHRAEYVSSLFFSLLLTLSLIALFLVFTLFLTYLITRRTCRPYELILELLRLPNLSAEERFQVYESRYASLDDLGMIATLIFRTQNENTFLHSQVANQQDLVRVAQRKALQAQINPHFLINTLEGIKWKLMELVPENREVPRIISSLAQLLKANLELNSPLTTVGEEIHQAKLYLQIQQYRFEGLFDVTWDVDASLLSCKTIRFSLQPLLENAITHGIKKVGAGSLFISVHSQGDMIRFVIHDSGAGIDAQTLETLRLSLQDSRATRDSHIGLTNVNARLQLIFGPEHRLQIHSRPTEGTTLTMDIPKALPSDMPSWIYEDLDV